MAIIEAVYRHGVFEPLKPVDLPEEQRVQVHVGTAAANGKADQAAIDQWFEEVKVLQDRIKARHGGLLPDSTVDIAEDRMR